MDPIALVAGIAAAFAVAAMAGLARLVHVRGALLRKTAALEETVEGLTDRVFELAESEERHRDLVDAQGDLIVRRDRQGIITFANQSYAALVGEPPDGLVGRTTGHHVIAVTAERHELDGSHSADERIATAEGERWIAWRHHPVRGSDGRLDEIQSAGRDITERKATEAELAESRARAESASSAKSRFLATVSHEIRTPLNGIMGMAALLIDTRLTPEQKTYAEAVKSSGEALLSLIDEILDFSKIEAGRLDLDIAPFELAALVEGVAELLGPRAHGKQLDLATAVAPDVPQRLMGDATRLRQVLLNLAGNAVKFTEAGGVAIAATREAGQLVVAISDTGPGIAPDDVERIFDEFEQGEATFARRHAGTGLGLAISRRLVARMGGTLGVDTVLGRGSVFTLRLPLAPAEEQPAPLGRLDGLTVLLVSPSAVEPEILSRRLKARGAEVLRAEAVAAIPADRHFDTALIDHRLGDDAVSATLSALDGRVERTVLVVTPAARGEIAGWREKGIAGWLISPVREASLVVQIPPRQAGGAATDPLDAREQTPPVRTDRPLKVLVAEDNEINALLVRRLLEKLGHEPVWVRDGRAAVEAALDPAQPFDLILMDMQMPECDGLSAAKMIRAREAAGRHLPIIALTANAFVEDRAAAIAAGMDAFVTKPLDRDRLAETLAFYGPITTKARNREGRRKAKVRP
ncbi:PAS domain-containing hybrid sensor histidine kinase/response regulator [Phreatobacter stygius]|uniref:Sensory/regulatory protein RpfC n=1 Tax=Phreatobacter stygius TaxID=1940610 RepID=A0A4D7B004_9HYPH|nr:ATP-binding protein [Phreatobacter stygius]QCI64353.1 response regulator [Phreatobacter stygius]